MSSLPQRTSEALLTLIQNNPSIVRKWKEVSTTTPIPYDKPSGLNLGYSFCIHSVDSRCLEEVAMRFMSEDAPKPVRVADIGAGHGFMSRLLTLFGAHVTAIERHKPVALITQRTLDSVTHELKRLGSSCTAQDVVRLINGDILGQYFGRLQAQFDVIWCARVIHQQHPRDIPRFLARLHTLLAEDGVLYLSAHACAGQPRNQNEYESVSGTRSLLHLYRENQRNGMRFPGFVGVKSMQTKMIFKDRRMTSGGKEFPLQFPGTEQVEPVALTEEQIEKLQPGSMFYVDANGELCLEAAAHHHTNVIMNRTRVVDFKGKGSWKDTPNLPEETDVSTYTSYTAMLVFELAELVREVTVAGFHIRLASYVDESGTLFPDGDKLSDAELEKRDLMIYIEATKMPLKQAHINIMDMVNHLEAEHAKTVGTTAAAAIVANAAAAVDAEFSR